MQEEGASILMEGIQNNCIYRAGYKGIPCLRVELFICLAPRQSAPDRMDHLFIIIILFKDKILYKSPRHKGRDNLLDGLF